MIFHRPQIKQYNHRQISRRRRNPYFSNSSQDHFAASKLKNTLAHISPRAWLWLFLIAIIALLLSWLFLFSNILIIKNIEVSETSLIPSFDIENLAQERLTKTKFLILSESRLAVFDAKALKNQITERYVVDKIQVSKKIPSTLVITIYEKTPTAVWFEADTYQQIDAAGWVLASVSGNVEGLPTIYNNGWPRINNKKIEGVANTITFAKSLNSEFSNRFSAIKIKQLTVDNEQDTIKLVPERGAIVYFSTIDNISSQIDRLDLLLLSELKGRFEKTLYIDLRFGDKVYYQ